MSESIALAIDIGGSKLVVGLVGESGRILAKIRHPWKEQTREGTFRTILKASRQLMETYPVWRPACAGATIPGLADRRQGLWVEASFSGIRDWPIAADLEEALGLPCAVDNDCRASALAERCFGEGQGVDDFLYMTVSNGIGAALFLRGELYEGAGRGAGELGHVQVVPGGRACGCGNQGCLEQHAAGPGITRNYQEVCGGLEALSAKEIAERARNRETAALCTYALEAEYLGKALAVAVNLLNPPLVVLGGGVSLAFDVFGPLLRRVLEDGVYRAANPSLRVAPSALGYDGALLGAAAIAFRGAENTVRR